jgi:hypothetical protein
MLTHRVGGESSGAERLEPGGFAHDVKVHPVLGGLGLGYPLGEQLGLAAVGGDEAGDDAEGGDDPDGGPQVEGVGDERGPGDCGGG